MKYTFLLMHFLSPLIIAIVLTFNAWGAPAKTLPVTFIHCNDIPPRLQWNHNSGYCGEVSLLSAGLYYGQYISQYDACAVATRLGLNDQLTASQMHLNCVEWNTAVEQNTKDFLAWVKQNVIKGFPVAIGIFTNEYLFYGKTNANAGDPDYDHIVPVTGITSLHPLTDPNYYDQDIIYFNDNGLWSDGSNPPYYFSYDFDEFQADRSQANRQNGPIYSLSNSGSNYGIAITGVCDLNGDTLPVRVDTDINYEIPQIPEGTSTRPPPRPIHLTVTISRLDPNTLYNLYRYNSLDKIPDSNFNANAASASQSWQIQIPTGTAYMMTLQINSDETAAFRAVRATAP